jgi:hypothetical protein
MAPIAPTSGAASPVAHNLRLPPAAAGSRYSPGRTGCFPPRRSERGERRASPKGFGSVAPTSTTAAASQRRVARTSVHTLAAPTQCMWCMLISARALRTATSYDSERSQMSAAERGTFMGLAGQRRADTPSASTIRVPNPSVLRELPAKRSRYGVAPPGRSEPMARLLRSCHPFRSTLSKDIATRTPSQVPIVNKKGCPMLCLLIHPPGALFGTEFIRFVSDCSLHRLHMDMPHPAAQRPPWASMRMPPAPRSASGFRIPAVPVASAPVCPPPHAPMVAPTWKYGLPQNLQK